MHNYFLAVLFLLMAGSAGAQTTISGSFVHDGLTRTYSFYVPASYVPGVQVPLVIGLHGTGSDGQSFAQYRDFRPIADTANFIVVNPDGSTMLGLKFWNYGNVLGSTVDDVGFLEALIDTIAADYAINPQRIYCAGMSNGSFMSYYMACQSDRFAAIGCVTGSMSVDMYNSCTPWKPTPVIHVHGTSDPTNPYAGTSTMKGIDDVVAYWVDQNECSTTPTVTAVPNTNTTDGATAEHYLYSGGIEDHTVELFKVIGGEHTWPGSPMPGSTDVTCMDFDATKELWRFFSQYERNMLISVEEQEAVKLNIWPNPVTEGIYIQSENHLITEVIISDLRGREVERRMQENIDYIDLSHLKRGHYIARISGNGFSVRKKLTVL